MEDLSKSILFSSEVQVKEKKIQFFPWSITLSIESLPVLQNNKIKFFAWILKDISIHAHHAVLGRFRDEYMLSSTLVGPASSIQHPASSMHGIELNCIALMSHRSPWVWGV